jgi:predicted permease
MENALKILTDTNFIYAIVLTIICVLIGYILRKHSVFNNNAKYALAVLITKIALPSLAFTSFLMDFDTDNLTNSLWIILIAFLAYFTLLGIFNLIFIKKEPLVRKTYSIIIVFGLISMYGHPIAASLFGDIGSFTASIMEVPFRTLLYTYCFFTISRTKFSGDNVKGTLKKVFLNPTIIAMILGIIIWTTQSISPTIVIGESSYSIFRIDKTLPWLYNVFKTLSQLTTPLAMILIGVSIGESSLIDAFKDKRAWVFASLRSFVIPMCYIGLIALFRLIPSVNFSLEMIITIIICAGAPISSVVNTYCIAYDNEAALCSNASLISTITSVISMPILILICSLIF